MSKTILFDGYCNLCNWSVQFIIKRDKRSIFRFASLQSKIGKAIINQQYISNKTTDSIIYFKDAESFIKSSAVLNILKDLGGGWRLTYTFIIVPKFIRDFIYDFIAKYRYKVFGRKSNCTLPSDEVKARFLD